MFDLHYACWISLSLKVFLKRKHRLEKSPNWLEKPMSLKKRFSDWTAHFRCDLGIDLGTANILVFAQSRGVIIQEPSVVALDVKNNHVLAVGDEAKKMIGPFKSVLLAILPNCVLLL